MHHIQVQNLKCGGCVTTITKGVSSLAGVSDVSVDIEKSSVAFHVSGEALIQQVKDKLSDMGYPEVNEENSLGKKAKSYVSCAVGRIGG